MRYRVTKLPQYIILYMCRFTKNNFFVEKNPTLVNFLVKNLELKDYIPLPLPACNEKGILFTIVSQVKDPIECLCNGNRKSYGTRCRIFMCRKHCLRWWHSLRRTCCFGSWGLDFCFVGESVCLFTCSDVWKNGM